MHLIAVVEGNANQIDSIIKWIGGRRYPDVATSTNPRFEAREMRLVNIVFPKEWKDSLMRDLRFVFKGDRRHISVQNSLTNNFFVKKLLKKLEFQPVDLDKHNAITKPFTSDMLKHGGNIPREFYCYPVGFLEDLHDERGHELI